MNNLAKKFESVMTAIAFAEAGEFETAVGMLMEQRDDVSDLAVKNRDMNMLARGV